MLQPIATRSFMVRAPLTFRLLLASVCCGAMAAQRTPDDALRVLQDGNARFAAESMVPQPPDAGARRSLARGIAPGGPVAVVLCCADSQLPPEHVFNARLGELVVVRIAGHAVDPEAVAAIENAVQRLAVPLCVVLAHEQCGAIAAAVARDGAAADRAVSPTFRALLDQLEPAVRAAKARELHGPELLAAAEEEHAQLTVHECLRRSSLLRAAVAANRLKIVAARCSLATGAVDWLPQRPLPAELAAEPAPAAPAPGTVPAGVAPHVALRMLQAGHRRFLGDGRPNADVTSARREALLHGQQPTAIVMTCCDPRVAPESVFDAGLGELFVVRTAGAALTDRTLASIEHAAADLGASLLVVMAHTRCDAVAAAAQSPESAELTPNERTLLRHLEPAATAARSHAAEDRDAADPAAAAHARRVVSEARARSSVLRALEHDGRFQLLACVYDVASGDLQWLQDAPVAGDACVEHAAPSPFVSPAPAGEVALPEAHEPVAPHAATPHTPPPAAAAAPAVPVDARPAIDPRLIGGLVGLASLLGAMLLAIRVR